MHRLARHIVRRKVGIAVQGAHQQQEDQPKAGFASILNHWMVNAQLELVVYYSYGTAKQRYELENLAWQVKL